MPLPRPMATEAYRRRGLAGEMARLACTKPSAPEGMPLGEGMPRVAAVGGFEDAAAGTAPGGVFPRPLARFPQGGVDDVGVRRVDLHVVGAGVVVLAEHLLEGPAAVGGAVHAAFRVGAVRMAEDGDEQAVGIPRVDGDLRNLLAVAQSQVSPGLAGVGRFVDAVSGGKIRPLQAFAAAHVDDIRIGRGDRDRADRAGGLLVEDGIPRAAVVVGLPDAAVAHADVEDVRLAGDARGGTGAPASQGSDGPPAHFREQIGIVGCGECQGKSAQG